MPDLENVAVVRKRASGQRKRRSAEERRIIRTYLEERLEDAQHAASRLREAFKIDRQDWIKNNVEYWDHVAAGLKWSLSFVAEKKEKKGGKTTHPGPDPGAGPGD